MTMTATKGIYITLGALLLAILLEGGMHGKAAICEWATGLYFLNFLALISFTDSFYETVHEKADL